MKKEEEYDPAHTAQVKKDVIFFIKDLIEREILGTKDPLIYDLGGGVPLTRTVSAIFIAASVYVYASVPKSVRPLVKKLIHAIFF